MKRIFSILLFLSLFMQMAWAEEVNVRLDAKTNEEFTVAMHFGKITFHSVEYNGTRARVDVTVSNTVSNAPMAILIFGEEPDEQALRKLGPKVQFNKSFPGEKGKRKVMRCMYVDNTCEVILPGESARLCTMEVKFSSDGILNIPFYIAEFNKKSLNKNGFLHTTFTISQVLPYQFNIEAEGWTENDPVYVHFKNSVDSLIAVVDSLKFCDNPKHKPSLAEQQAPYRNAIDSLDEAIQTQWKANNWMSDDLPSLAYNQLSTRLREIDLNSKNYDCNDKVNHGYKPPVKHNCGYCKLSAKEIQDYLDDLNQKLYTGKISKAEARRIAKALYTCYQKNQVRKKDRSSETKIKKNYDRITR